MIYFVKTEIKTVEVLRPTYIRSEAICIQKQYFPDKIEKFFFTILLSKSKPIVGGIIYRSPTQNRFIYILPFKILSKNFFLLTKMQKKPYIFADFNITMYENNKYIVHESNSLQKICIS